MTRLNISQAAKVVGISRKTMQAHIKKGKISCDVDEDGRKWIDVSELARGYENLDVEAIQGVTGNGAKSTQHYTPNDTPFLREKISMLEQRIVGLEVDKEEGLQREKELRVIIDKQTTSLLPKPEEAQPAPQQKAQSLSWLNATLIGCGVVGTGVGITAAFVTWVLPHIR